MQFRYCKNLVLKFAFKQGLLGVKQCVGKQKAPKGKNFSLMQLCHLQT